MMGLLDWSELPRDVLGLACGSSWFSVNPGGRDCQTDEAEYEQHEPERLEPGEAPEPIEHPSEGRATREITRPVDQDHPRRVAAQALARRWS